VITLAISCVRLQQVANDGASWRIFALTQSPLFYDEEPTIVHNEKHIFVFWNRGHGTPAESQLAAYRYSNNWSNCRLYDLTEQSECQYHLYPAAFTSGGRIWVAMMGRDCKNAAYAILLREYDENLALLRQNAIVLGKDWIVYDPSLYVDDQFVYLLFVDDRTRHRDVFFRKLNRYSWQTIEERQLTQNSSTNTTSWVTSITKGTEGRFYVAYSVSDASGLAFGDIQLELWDENIQMKIHDKRIFGAPLVTAPSLQFYQNHLFVAYQNSQRGNWDIFLREYDDNLSYVQGSEERVTQGLDAQQQPWLDIIQGRLVIVYDEGHYEVQGSYSSRPKDIFRAERPMRRSS